MQPLRTRPGIVIEEEFENVEKESQQCPVNGLSLRDALARTLMAGAEFRSHNGLCALYRGGRCDPQNVPEDMNFTHLNSVTCARTIFFTKGDEFDSGLLGIGPCDMLPEDEIYVQRRTSAVRAPQR